MQVFPKYQDLKIKNKDTPLQLKSTQLAQQYIAINFLGKRAYWMI
ncbi:hypothetical protein ykris0001_30900 [Yersinia kristensenii ATCC 33638]|nr:hypothetical protein ykris0001_30900 [Yersinia kristensenii ATCC 33638]